MGYCERASLQRALRQHKEESVDSRTGWCWRMLSDIVGFIPDLEGSGEPLSF